MKRHILVGMIAAITFLAIAANPVFGQVGTIRIEPHGSYYPSPIMLSSPATFNISVVTQAADPTTDPHILLVMTNSCYHGLTGTVNVTWTGGFIAFPKPWTEVNTGEYVPPTGTVPGVRYQASSLKDHLNTSDSVWWAYGPFLAGNITQTKQEFTVTLPSTDPRMLVYAIGKTGEETELFNNRVPPTKAGFVVPELGPVLLALASFSAFALFAIRRRKVMRLK
jgi:hypothetical protein